MHRVPIDPNIHTKSGNTWVTKEEFPFDLPWGTQVEVYVPETDLVGKAIVISTFEDLIYLSVDWPNLQPAVDPLDSLAKEFAIQIVDSLTDSCYGIRDHILDSYKPDMIAAYERLSDDEQDLLVDKITARIKDAQEYVEKQR